MQVQHQLQQTTEHHLLTYTIYQTKATLNFKMISLFAVACSLISGANLPVAEIRYGYGHEQYEEALSFNGQDGDEK